MADCAKLACHTEEEIAKAVGVAHDTVSRVSRENAKLRFCVKLTDFPEIVDDEKRLDAAQEQNVKLSKHLIDFEPPLYNIWKQQRIPLKLYKDKV